MAYLASKKMTYWGQLGILTALVGGGFIIGGIVSIIPLLSKIDLRNGINLNQLLIPENANALRWMQFLSTMFLFFIPTVIYAKICHIKPFSHLGFTQKINLGQVGIVILIMFVGLFLSEALGELVRMIPFSKSTLLKFQTAEDEYNKQVAVIGRMQNIGEYFLSVLMLAVLPAVFEETLFRGGLQNLLERWWKQPLLAIIVTSVFFSAAHGSYYGFLSRAMLGFVLGWMYHRTGNIWLNIIAHAANNIAGVSQLYFIGNKGTDISKTEMHISPLIGLVSVVALILLFRVFDKVSKRQIVEPGKEWLIENETSSNPDWIKL